MPRGNPPAVKGYRCVFTIPDKMARLKIDVLRAFGAEVIVCPTAVPPDDPRSYYERAKRIAAETPGAFYVDQYHSSENIDAHYRSTGPEIWRQTNGAIDYFVAGLGTGGTMSGAGRYLKERKPEIKCIGVDPAGSIFKQWFDEGTLAEPHVYQVEGIGEDMLCGALDFAVLDEIRRVDDRQCFSMTRRLCREEGIFAGGSSGGAVHAAIELAAEKDRDEVVVVILPDSGTRYVEKVYSDAWMAEHGFL